MGLLKGGIPLGISFSFLITSPLVNEYVAVIMLGFFGWKITLLYIITGMLIGIFGGMILGMFKLEKYIDKDFKIKANKWTVTKKYDFKARLKYGLDEAIGTIQNLWLWVIAGVGIGALIHGYIPDEIIHSFLESSGIFMVPIAVILGIPIYANCAAVVPIAVVLFNKGIPIGTALAFMMATSALSLPEAIILKHALKIKLILIFFGVVGLSLVVIGYLFNSISSFLV